MEIELREVVDGDLPHFFEHQLDQEANHMAAFTARDPQDNAAFQEHWARIRSDDSVLIRTILETGQVAGYVVGFERDGQPEISYWIGKQFWGKGLATEALSRFLEVCQVRPLQARVAKDNLASIRVLEKSGFSVIGDDRGFANARGMKVEEYILELPGAS